ncbi:MAG: hypothetical protein WC897_05730 [Candidatus Gracilibacteria bacterium]
MGKSDEALDHLDGHVSDLRRLFIQQRSAEEVSVDQDEDKTAMVVGEAPININLRLGQLPDLERLLQRLREDAVDAINLALNFAPPAQPPEGLQTFRSSYDARRERCFTLATATKPDTPITVCFVLPKSDDEGTEHFYFKPITGQTAVDFVRFLRELSVANERKAEVEVITGTPSGYLAMIERRHDRGDIKSRIPSYSGLSGEERTKLLEAILRGFFEAKGYKPEAIDLEPMVAQRIAEAETRAQASLESANKAKARLEEANTLGLRPQDLEYIGALLKIRESIHGKNVLTIRFQDLAMAIEDLPELEFASQLSGLATHVKGLEDQMARGDKTSKIIALGALLNALRDLSKKCPDAQY